jgi:hypothetical protein
VYERQKRSRDGLTWVLQKGVRGVTWHFVGAKKRDKRLSLEP